MNKKLLVVTACVTLCSINYSSDYNVSREVTPSPLESRFSDSTQPTNLLGQGSRDNSPCSSQSSAWNQFNVSKEISSPCSSPELENIANRLGSTNFSGMSSPEEIIEPINIRKLPEYQQRRNEVKNTSKEVRSYGTAALYCTVASVISGATGLFLMGQESCSDSATICALSSSSFGYAAYKFLNQANKSFEKLETRAKINEESYLQEVQKLALQKKRNK